MHILKLTAEIVGIFIALIAFAALVVIAIISRDSAEGRNDFE